MKPNWLMAFSFVSSLFFSGSRQMESQNSEFESLSVPSQAGSARIRASQSEDSNRIKGANPGKTSEEVKFYKSGTVASA